MPRAVPRFPRQDRVTVDPAPHARAMLARGVAQIARATPASDAPTSRRPSARSRASLVRVTPCASEMMRAESSGAVPRGSDDDGRESDGDGRAMARRAFFASNACAAMVCALGVASESVRAAEAAPEAYARAAREVVETLSASLEHERANAGASAGERFRYAEPAKKAVKAYISYDADAGGVASSASYADISEALRELSAFYKRAGATAPLDPETRDRILKLLYDARDLLPPAPPSMMDKLLDRVRE